MQFSGSQRGARSTSDRSILTALLRLSTVPSENWSASIQQILQIDADVLGVERVSYWSLRKKPTLIHCEMGYVASLHAFEHGSTLLESQHPSYFAELSNAVVAIEDARVDPRTAELQEYVRVRDIDAMLDVPVWARGDVAGVLCHEHSGAPRHWSESDMDFAMGVAQTVAAAIEAHARGNAEHGERRSTFLDRASLRLSEARCLRAVADEAMALVVPDLADWALLDVVCDGGMQRVGLAHRTSEGRAALDEITRRYPPQLDGPHPTVRALALGQSVLLPEITAEALAVSTVDEQHAHLIEHLGLKSMLAVPLLYSGHIAGVLLLHNESRQYDNRDLKLVEELAQRIAVALDNVRLHKKAQEAIRARDEFIALAAHELHNPLAAMQLASQTLANNVASMKAQSIARMAGTIVRQSQRLTRLVDHMLDASRIAAKRLDLSKQRIDLSELVSEIARSFEQRVSKARSSLKLTLEPHVVGYWDSDRLSQVVYNLLDNAVKFSNAKPIELYLRREGDVAVLAICDHGFGISPEHMATLFEPFVRGATSRGYGGLGLGLYMADSIVAAHGGEISLDSQPGEGSSFTVRLPLDADAAARSQPGTA